MKRGRQLAELVLGVVENNQLSEWTQRHNTSQALALRSRIVLACAQGAGNSEVAQRLQVTPQTVGKWRSRFVEKRLNGLLYEPRPGNTLHFTISNPILSSGQSPLTRFSSASPDFVITFLAHNTRRQSGGAWTSCPAC